MFSVSEVFQVSQSDPEPLDLLVLLLLHGAQLVFVLTGQLLGLYVQGGAAALARQLQDEKKVIIVIISSLF